MVLKRSNLDQRICSYGVRHDGELFQTIRTIRSSRTYTTAIRPEHQLSVSFDQSLIMAKEDEARLMIKNKLTTEKEIPNFLDYIHEDGLKAIKPEAVNIIR